MGSTTEFILWTEGRDGKQPEPILFIASDENPSEDWTQVDRLCSGGHAGPARQSMRRLGGRLGGPVSSGMDAAPDAAPDAGPVSSFGPARIVASDGTGVSAPGWRRSTAGCACSRADPRYREAMDRMQFGQWPEVRDLLAELQTDYPQGAGPGCAAQRGAVAGRSGHPLGNQDPRSPPDGRTAAISAAQLPFVLLIGLVIAGWAFYNSYVAPSRRVVAMANAIHNMAAEAQTLVQNAL